MKPLHVVAVFASALLVAASAHAQKKPNPCGNDIPVSIQVLDAPVDLEYPRHALRSDGAVYQHGVDRIDARIQKSNCTTDLWMGLGLSPRRMRLHVDPASDDTFTTVVSFNFDRLGSVPVTNSSLLSSSYCTAPPADNYGGCGFDANNAVYVRRPVTLQWELGNNDILKLRRAPEDVGNWAELEATSWVRVYHPHDGLYVLSPEPVASASAAAAHIAAMSRKEGRTFQKFVEMPVRIIVTPVP